MFIWLLVFCFVLFISYVIVLRKGVLSQTVVMNPYQCLCASVYPQQQVPSTVDRASSLYSSVTSAYPVSPSVHLKIHKHHHYVDQQGSLQVMNPCSHWLHGVAECGACTLWVSMKERAVCCMTTLTLNFLVSCFSSGEGEDHRVKGF